MSIKLYTLLFLALFWHTGYKLALKYIDSDELLEEVEYGET